jgi:crossover junction endodeoxyribonuclease RuvC
VLGVDPGLTRCGLGVVDGGAGRTVRCVAVDVVCTPVEDDLSRRLLRLTIEVERWLDEYRPDVVAIERVFSQYNVRTAMGTAQAGGVVALAAARRDLPVMFHTPSEVKAAVTGSGRADKAQVTTMVTRLLNLSERPSPADAADALALAICHLWRAPMRTRLAEAEARAKELAKHHKSRLAAAAREAATARETAAAREATVTRKTAAAPESPAAESAAVRRAAAREAPADVPVPEAEASAAKQAVARDARAARAAPAPTANQKTPVAAAKQAATQAGGTGR